jgi:hypothetical protein
MFAQKQHQLTPEWSNNLGDPQATSQTDGAQSGDIPQARFASRTDFRVDSAGPPHVSTAETAGKTIRGERVAHVRKVDRKVIKFT